MVLTLSVIIWWILIGLVVGAVARLVIPGRQHIGILFTILIGIVAAIVGGILTAILSLTLGIGATVSVFSIIYAVLMNPWPYQGADRIASIMLLDKSDKGQDYGLNGLQTRELAKAHSLEYVIAFNGWNLTITGSDVPEGHRGHR